MILALRHFDIGGEFTLEPTNAFPGPVIKRVWIELFRLFWDSPPISKWRRATIKWPGLIRVTVIADERTNSTVFFGEKMSADVPIKHVPVIMAGGPVAWRWFRWSKLPATTCPTSSWPIPPLRSRS